MLEQGQEGVEGVVCGEEEVGGDEEWEDDLGVASVRTTNEAQCRGRGQIDSRKLGIQARV